MSVLEPRLDSRTATLALFAFLLVSIVAISAASVSDTDLPAFGLLAVVVGLVGAITLLTGAVVVAIVALFPHEHAELGAAFVEGLVKGGESENRGLAEARPHGNRMSRGSASARRASSVSH